MKTENLEQAAENYAEKWNDLENQFKLSSCFIAGAKFQQEQDKKCYHPMTERKHTSDVHFECTICGYNHY